MVKPYRRCPSGDYRFPEERLRFVIRASGLNHGEFARMIGLPGGGEEVYNLLSRHEPLPVSVVWRIHAFFPQIDPQWLLTGETG